MNFMDREGTFSRGRSSVWLERLPVTQEVASSSLVGPAVTSTQYTSFYEIKENLFIDEDWYYFRRKSTF